MDSLIVDKYIIYEYFTLIVFLCVGGLLGFCGLGLVCDCSISVLVENDLMCLLILSVLNDSVKLGDGVGG